MHVALESRGVCPGLVCRTAFSRTPAPSRWQEDLLQAQPENPTTPGTISSCAGTEWVANDEKENAGIEVRRWRRIRDSSFVPPP
ncbi:hypothetical protein ATI53_102524 [Salipiger aestuarii]|uniref:Uncharacterized protein n=1 Tax=Salipiger aestuarii TaxID=568098 RepID=A0A327Y284_9RHOB|nr:hypothetical protein ATI53_102524 [Salipiger aestuarii]